MANIRTNAEVGKITKLSLTKAKELPDFTGKNVIRYYIAISSRVINGVFGLHIQSNISKDFPIFKTKSFTTKGGQHITADKIPGGKIYIDNQPFPSGTSFNIFVTI